MTQAAQRIASAALSLPPKVRAQLADRLLESLEAATRAKLDDLWAQEVEARIDAYEKGHLKTVPAKDVFYGSRAKRR